MDAFENRTKSAFGDARFPHTSPVSPDSSNAAGEMLSVSAAAAAAAAAVTRAVQHMLIPNARGQVVLPQGVSIDDIQVTGNDLVITLPNGEVMIIPNGAVNIPSISVDDATIPATTVAQLLEGLTDLNPEAGLRSSGGNFAVTEGEVQAGFDIGDLLPYTELAFPEPRDEELLPSDINRKPDIFIETPNNPAGAVNAADSVNEAGLDDDRTGDTSPESAGTDAASTSNITNGTIRYSAPDGLETLTINGTVVSSLGQQISGDYGTLTITSISNGVIGYNYVLNDNVDNREVTSEIFAVVVTERDGDEAAASLTIAIINDAPIASADLGSVLKGTDGVWTAIGNIILGDSSGGIADTAGADGGLTVTGVVKGAVADEPTALISTGLTVTGDYGSLTLNSNGTYSYVRDLTKPLPNTNADADADASVSDVFTYQIKDSDGDYSTATLTISVTDQGVAVTDFKPAIGDGNVTVYEAGLADGTTPADDNAPTQAAGSFTVSAPDGVALLTISLGDLELGTIPPADGDFPLTFATSLGNSLVIDSYNPKTGVVNYHYVLLDNETHANGLNNNLLGETFTVTLVDLDGDTASGNFTIDIVDDVPLPRNDSDTVIEGATATGNVLTGEGTAQGTDNADSAGADGYHSGGGVVGVSSKNVPANNGTSLDSNGNLVVVGQFGTLTLHKDGGYSYKANPNSVTQNETDTFIYSVKDGDGDVRTAELKIDITNVTLTPPTTTDTVYEAALDTAKSGDDLAAGTVTGSTPALATETATGSVNFVGSFTPQTNVQGTYGVFEIKADGSYTYTLTKPFDTTPDANNGSNTQVAAESFSYTAVDANGNSVTGTITIDIVDDVPLPRNDSDTVIEGATATGNVLTGEGTTQGTDNADSAGADGYHSGGGVVGVSSKNVPANSDTSLDSNGNLIVLGQFGTLTLHKDGGYSYKANPNSVAQNETDTFIYSVKDGDGDVRTAELKIDITNVTLTPPTTTNTVYEAALDTAKSGDDLAAGTVTGSTPALATETATGSVNFVGSFTPQTNVQGTYGVFEIKADGSYTYTLTKPFDTTPDANNGSNTQVAAESFSYTAVDANGNSVTGTITIDIVDDVPIARPDTDSIGSRDISANGNVLTGSLTNEGEVNADIQGADDAKVSGARTEGQATYADVTAAGTMIVGRYGQLQIDSSGKYTYTLNRDHVDVKNLSSTETLPETFEYYISDGDGDRSFTTLTILISGNNQAPTFEVASTAVSDEGFTIGNKDTTGDTDTTNLLERSGTIAAFDLDGDELTFSLGVPVLSLTSDGIAVTWADSTAQSLIGKANGVEVIRVTIDNDGNFTVKLSKPIDHPDTSKEDALKLLVPVTVSDGTASHTSANGLTISLEDDSPIAIAPVQTFIENGAGAVVVKDLDSDGNLANNYGGDGAGGVIFTAESVTRLAAQNLSSGGQTLSFTISADGKSITAEKPNGDEVFVIRLQPGGNDNKYSVEMLDKLDTSSKIDYNANYTFDGGNRAWVDLAPSSGTNGRDLLITPIGGSTVNEASKVLGVGNNLIEQGEAIRLDFVTDVTGIANNGGAPGYDNVANRNHNFTAHYVANNASAKFTNIGYKSVVRLVAFDDVNGDNVVGDGAKDALTAVVISYNNISITVQNLGGTPTVHSLGQNGPQVTVTFVDGEARVEGVMSDMTVGGVTGNGYNSIEFHHAGGSTFKIGGLTADAITQQPVTFDVPVKIVDADGDSASGTINVKTSGPLLVVGSANNDEAGQTDDHIVSAPQGAVDGAISGGAGDDTLIGDPGAVTVTQGAVANIVLVLDSSSSMVLSNVSFGGSSITRLAALKLGVTALLNDLTASGAQDVRVTIIDFGTTATNLGVFDLVVNGVPQNTSVNNRLSAAVAAVNGINARSTEPYDYTNYEDALQKTLTYVSGTSPLASASVNQVVFVSDGDPTRWIDPSGTVGGSGNNFNQTALNEVFGNTSTDNSNEPQQILAKGFTIEAIGIGVNTTTLGRLSQLELRANGNGSAVSVTTAEQLSAALSGLGGSIDLAAASDDTINGGDGADIIFGDVVFTDVLAQQTGVALAPGSGWKIFQTLEARTAATSIDPAGDGGLWTRADTIAYLRNNHAELGLESGRTGGNDTINGGSGDDIIYGQEGNDTIDGGSGNDYINGGSGNDTIRGGTGNDIIDGGTGNDIIYGEDGDDSIFGGAGNDTIDGDAGDDIIYGEDGVDTIRGGTGNDTLYGGAGNDVIEGGAGNDVIYGGAGGDILTGNSGRDYFVIGSGDSRVTLSGNGISGFDRVTDFAMGDNDRLVLNGTPSVTANTTGRADGDNSNTTTSNGNTIRSHTVANGVITFYDANANGSVVTISSGRDVAAAVNYMRQFDFGSANVVVGFVAGTGTGARSFIYQQLSDASPGTTTANFTLVELTGVTNATGANSLQNILSGGLIAQVPQVPPIVLDLDGDGLTFLSRADGVAFDYMGNGEALGTGWVSGGDGILAIDINRNGTADNGSEIVFGGEGLTDLQGLAADFDSNGDGVLDANDEHFSLFGVWQDANGNGISDEGEFRTLEDLGIVSINLSSDNQSYSAADGDVLVHGQTSFTRADGTTGIAGDVSFTVNGSQRQSDQARFNVTSAGTALAAALVAVAWEAELLPAAEAHVTTTAPAAGNGNDNEASAPETGVETADADVSPIAPANDGADDAAAPSSNSNLGDSDHSADFGAGQLLVADNDRADEPADSDNAPDALFDLVAASSGAVMDQLIGMPVEAASNIAADEDTVAADAVLQEVAADNAVDTLLDAVLGQTPSAAGSDAASPADLAQLLDQQIAPSDAHQQLATVSLEQELSQIPQG